MKKLISALTWTQRILIVAGALSVGLAVYGIARVRHESLFRPLYTSLSAEDAGAVVQKLKESGVEYRLSNDGATISVPVETQAELRLAMASAGLPKSGRIGFELFDRTNFGTTEFVEHINYRRALEGELERSVMSLAEVEQARVHITFPKDSVFLEGQQPAKASVLLRLRPGARLSPQNTQAISHLVASAVEGLAPTAVSVLDMNGNLLARGRRPGSEAGSEPSADTLDYRQQIEKELVAKVTSTLEPLIGPDKLRVGAFVECDMTSGEQTEETFDPSRSVMLTSNTSEDITGPAAATAGIPGTASNLPRPPQPRPAATSGGITRRSENVTYQTSRTVRQTHIPQGTIKRMSLAVLVDHNVIWEGEGANRVRKVVAPAPETLKTIRDLVAAAAGLKPDRGDQLIVESLPFDETVNAPPVAAPVLPVASTPQSTNRIIDYVRERPLLVLIGIGITVLAVLLRAVVLLLKWRRRRRLARVSVTSAPALEGAPAEAPGEIQAAEAAARPELIAPGQGTADLVSVRAKKADVLVVQIKDILTRQPQVPAAVVRSWLKQEGMQSS